MVKFDDIKGKRALVTGACGVIGRWLAQTLHEAGATLCLTDAKQSELDAFAKELGLGGDSFVKTADLTDETSIVALAAEVGKRWGRPIFWSTTRVSIPARSCSTPRRPSSIASSASICARLSF